MIISNHDQIPKNRDGILRVLVIGRVSTMHQQISNIEAGYDYAERVVKDLKPSQVYIKRLGEQASGMKINRKTILEAKREIKTGTWDLVLLEDMSKAYRNPRFIYEFVQNCVDARTRLIAPGDCLDTFFDNWQIMLSTAAMRHGAHIDDTRRRVRRTADSTFHKGGMHGKVRFGYRKLTKDEANSGQFGIKGLRLTKLRECTATIMKMRDMVVHEDREYEWIADWLNTAGVNPGPYVESGRWTGKLVSDLLQDGILCGRRTFRKHLHEYVYDTGERILVPNARPEQERVTDLAHMTEDEFEELSKVMEARAAVYRGKTGPDHPRHRVPRSHSIAPAQLAVCEACSRVLHQFGRDVLKCQNAHVHGPDECWNHVQVPCELTRVKIIDRLLERIDRTPGARAAMLDAAWNEIEHTRRRALREQGDCDHEIAGVKKQIANLTEAIALGGQMESLVETLNVKHKELKALQKQKLAAEAANEPDQFAESRQALELNPRQTLLALAQVSFEFADLLRRIIPRFVVRPVQALDTPLVKPRAIITLNLGALAADELEVLVHVLRVDRRGHQRRRRAGQRVDGGKDVEPVVLGLLDGHGPRAPLGPDLRQRALLADAGFVLEPDLDAELGLLPADLIDKKGARSSQSAIACGSFLR